MSNLIYVAGPYSDDDKTVVRLRMNKFAGVMATLIEHKCHPVSPMLNHYLSGIVDIKFPLTWEWWKEYSLLLLSKCEHMIVITGPGWEKSTGVAAEIEMANELNIPVTYVDKRKDVLEFVEKNYKGD